MNIENYAPVFIKRHSEIEKDIFQLKKYILKVKKEKDILRRNERTNFLFTSMGRFLRNTFARTRNFS